MGALASWLCYFFFDEISLAANDALETELFANVKIVALAAVCATLIFWHIIRWYSGDRSDQRPSDWGPGKRWLLRAGQLACAGVGVAVWVKAVGSLHAGMSALLAHGLIDQHSSPQLYAALGGTLFWLWSIGSPNAWRVYCCAIAFAVWSQPFATV
jgi:hypothetical protein